MSLSTTCCVTPQVVCAPPTVKIISINRVAVTALQKCLIAVAEKEGLVNAEDAIESALENSRGDVRNAILTFQVLCVSHGCASCIV